MSDLPPEPRPRRGFLRGWRKFAAALLVVLLLLVVCLPWIAGSFAPGLVARAFAERFQGKIELGGAQLSWFGTQTLKDAVLFDPQGHEVARLDVELPSLVELARGGGHALGTIRAQLRAALVADEQGVTNLERALAPRAAAQSTAGAHTPDTEAASASGPEPELELELTSPLCSWSDAHTRAAGAPFEVRGLRVHVALHPGTPARFEAKAEFAGEHPGTLALDAEVAGLRTQGALGFSKARASGKVQGFSSAMLDGLAQQHGRLEQVLGERFDLSFELSELSQNSGTLSCALQSPRTHLVLEGRVQDGILRCSEQRGFSLELGEPRALLEGFLAPLLPPGTALVWPATDSSWKLECPTLALPLPSAAPADRAGWVELLGRAELDAHLSIPGPIGFQNELTRGINLQPALSGLDLRIVAGSKKPLSASFDARLIAGETGTLHAELLAADPWTTLARGELPVVDGKLEIKDVSNATLDALLGREHFLTEGLGRVLELRVAIEQASLAGGTLEATLHSANIDLGLHGSVVEGNLIGSTEHVCELRFAPPAGWLERQLGPALPPGAKLRLEAQPFGAKIMNFSLPLQAADLDARLAGTQASVRLSLPGFSLTLADGREVALDTSVTVASLGRGGRCALRSDLRLVKPGPSTCVLQGDLTGIGELARGVLPPLSFDLSLAQLPTSSLEPWIASGGRASALLGEKLDLKLRAEQLDLRGGTLDLLVHSSKLEARLALAGAKGTWRSSGAETDRVALALEPADLTRELGPFLPEGTQLALDPKAATLELRLRELALVMPADPALLADPAQLASALRAKVELLLPGCSFTNALTKQAGIEPALENAVLQAEVADKGELVLGFDARIGGAGDARLHAEARGSSLESGSARLRIQALPASIVDALIGQPAALSGLLGDTLELEGDFERAARGSGALSFTLRAPHGEAGAAGKLEAGAFVLAEPAGLHVRLEPTDAWLAGQLAGRLPAGSQLRRASGLPRPFDLSLHAERIALPTGTQTLTQALAGTAARLDVQLPDLAFEQAGSAPLELRDLVLGAKLSQQPGSSLALHGKIAGDPAGDLAFEFRALDALALLAEENGLARFRIAAHGSAHGVPIGIVDALAGQGGLLVEALGARADLSLESSGISLDAGTFVVDLVSPQAPVHFDGEMSKGELRVTKPKGASARFGLGPLTSTRFVGRIVPLVCEVTKPEGAAPASVEVDALSLPLNGDLSKLDGLLRVDLGEINYAVLPGLKGLFGSQAQKPVKLPAFAVPIQKGVVRYDKLVLPIGGHEYSFHGSYSLVDGAMQLGTSIPLELLGSKVNSELDKARGLIDGKTLVPIEIRGTFSKPQFSIGKGFLDDVVKKALGGALESGLEGLLKKKKKPN